MNSQYLLACILVMALILTKKEKLFKLNVYQVATLVQNSFNVISASKKKGVITKS